MQFVSVNFLTAKIYATNYLGRKKINGMKLIVLDVHSPRSSGSTDLILDRMVENGMCVEGWSNEPRRKERERERHIC